MPTRPARQRGCNPRAHWRHSQTSTDRTVQKCPGSVIIAYAQGKDPHRTVTALRRGGVLPGCKVTRRAVRFAANQSVFVQGAEAASVFYIRAGTVKLLVLSSGGKEAVVAMLNEG